MVKEILEPLQRSGENSCVEIVQMHYTPSFFVKF